MADIECRAFVWIGQGFKHCERCSRDITVHDGLNMGRPGAGPFDTEDVCVPFSEAMQRMPLFAHYVTPVDAGEGYEGPWRWSPELKEAYARGESS